MIGVNTGTFMTGELYYTNIFPGEEKHARGKVFKKFFSKKTGLNLKRMKP